MASVMLTLRGGTARIREPKNLVDRYDAEVRFGPAYYRAAWPTNRHTVQIADLAYAVLLAGRPRPEAAKALSEQELDIGFVPDRPIEELNAIEHEAVVDGIMLLVRLPGFGCAVATKVLHKKRPKTVPVLDNLAIFATYMNPAWKLDRDKWPQRSTTVKSRGRIMAALKAVAADLSNPINVDAWGELERLFPLLTRVELFDKVWWVTARSQPPRTAEVDHEPGPYR